MDPFCPCLFLSVMGVSIDQIPQLCETKQVIKGLLCFSIDATSESGLFGRLVNHSCKNFNCTTKPIEVDGKPRLILVASRLVNAGEELLYDYGDRSSESLKAHPWLAY